MAVEHNVITDPNIHEPKGVAAASANDVYVANGAGSGTWQPIGPSTLDGIASNGNNHDLITSDGAGGFQLETAPSAVYGEAYVYANATATTFTTPDTFQKVGTSITWSAGHEDGVTWDTDHFEILEDGDYKISAAISITGSGTNKDYYFEFGVDTGGGIAELQHGRMATRTTASGDKKCLTLQAIDPFSTGDLIYVMAKCTDGTACTISNVNFTIEMKERT